MSSIDKSSVKETSNSSADISTDKCNFSAPSHVGEGWGGVERAGVGVDIVTLGCSKNLVDSERLIYMLEQAGYVVTHDSDNPQGEIAIINTCGFIGDAKEESINMILKFCQAKEEGRVKKVLVMGCLSERYLQELGQEIPQVDKFYGKFDWENVVKDLKASNDLRASQGYERKITTPSHYAYLKISEGCDRHCAYCAIPIITGKHKSRTMESIIEEVEHLVAQGVKEFQVIAQELTYYGVDLYGKQCIAELVERMAKVNGVEWIRLHYAYPTSFPMDLLRVMRENDNVCKYLDIALQHISTKVLANMDRHINKEDTYQLIETMRREVPGIHIRTTLMVGFPGEGEAEFEELKEFARWARFDRMGAFAYCEEDGTPAAARFDDEVPEVVKQERLDELMNLQQEISAYVQAKKVGTTMRVIIDRTEGEYYVGRTEFDSPEVDPEVLVPLSQGKLRIGQFYDIHIVDSDDFDLFGEVAQ